ncbi:hypothetical protein A4G18_07455 [Pasteurellaceae bacterium Pebbles2]|nr:hypothetical protein [Pasteurellaceae bacterium Pebbles2]
MSNNLDLTVQLSAMDKVSVPLKAAMSGFEKLANTVKQSQDQLDKFNKLQGQANQFAKLRQETNEYSKALEKAKSNAKQLEMALGENEKRYKSAKGSLGNATQRLNEQRAKLKELTVVQSNMMKKNQNHIVGYGSLSQIDLEIKATKDAIKSATEEQKKFKGETKSLETVVNDLKKSLQGENATVKKVGQNYNANVEYLRKLQSALDKAEFDTKDFSHSQTQLASNIEKTNRALVKQKTALNIVAKAKNIGTAFKNHISKSYQMGQGIAMTGIGSHIAGQKLLQPVTSMGRGVASMAETAGKFEQLQSVLEITEGSSEKAKQSLDWVKKFAVDTPANVDEAAEAFVRLRAYGLDPTNGLLMSLGDTAAAMGKPVMQAVEAIADAVTGENERLKEFGIKGSAIKGSNIIEYAYTDKSGKQRVAKVDKTNRKQIEETLKAIFNEKYAGAMEKQSKTLMGIWSKLEDVWTAFQLEIMQSGAFDWIKAKLQDILDTFDTMSQNGELQKWANDIGSVIMEVAQGLWACAETVVDMGKAIAQLARENKGVIATMIKWSAIIGIAFTVLAPFILTLAFVIPILVTLGKTFLITINIIKTLSTAVLFLGKNFLKAGLMMLTNPIGLIILAVAALSAGIYYLWKHWETVKQALIDGWNWVCNTFENNPILNVLFPIVPLIQGIISVIENWETITETASQYFDQSWTAISGFFNSGINNITQTILSWSPINLFTKAFEAVLSWFGVDLPKSFNEFGSNMLTSMSDGILEAFKTVQKAISSTVDWIKEKLGFSTEAEVQINQTKTKAEQIKVGANDVPVTDTSLLQQKWVGGYVEKINGFASGGYTGNGGKYQPAGIVHAGEYVITKEATTRLGLPLLNALNYGKNALLATGLGMSVATAAPIQIDDRPPLRSTQSQHINHSPMQITINVNAHAGQDEQLIAKLVAQKVQEIQQRQQAKMRSSLRDRD